MHYSNPDQMIPAVAEFLDVTEDEARRRVEEYASDIDPTGERRQWAKGKVVWYILDHSYFDDDGTLRLCPSG
jgi:hypothetical protein